MWDLTKLQSIEFVLGKGMNVLKKSKNHSDAANLIKQWGEGGEPLCWNAVFLLQYFILAIELLASNNTSFKKWLYSVLIMDCK